DERQLGRVHAQLAHLCLDTEDVDGALSWATSALGLAKAVGDRELEVSVQTIVAFARFQKGDSEGRRQLELIRARAAEADLEQHVCQADAWLIGAALQQRDYTRASAYLAPALGFASERGIELFRGYLLAYQAQVDLDLGGWDAATETARLILSEPRRSRIPKIIALAVIGRVRARRGDPDVWPALDDALSLADTGDGAGACARIGGGGAEAAGLGGDLERIERETAAVFAFARQCRSPWVVAELAAWRRRAGLDDQLPDSEMAGPYALEVAGAWQAAAARWRELDCPYEAALALAESGDPDPMRDAVEELQRLTARPAAAIIARQLRERGIRGMPRGSRQRTRENPAGLTARELEVLSLLVEGLRNSEIASRLVVSEKTAEHHVSAILRKLSVGSRGEAAAAAVRLGLTRS